MLGRRRSGSGWSGARGWLLSLMLGVALGGARAQTAAVPSLTLTSITGTWYEVARYPVRAEKKCVGDAVTLFALADKQNHFTEVDSCVVKDGSTSVRNLSGSRQKKRTDGELKVSTLFPFSRKLWVLALGQGGTWMLMGSPNHKQLWVYSKTAVVSEDLMTEIRTKIAAEGFDAGKLVMSPQGIKVGRQP